MGPAVTAVAVGIERRAAYALAEFGELTPISRFGGQGRVYRPGVVPAGSDEGPLVVKVYRRAPPAGAESVLASMVAWRRSVPVPERIALERVAAWPLAIVRAGEVAAGIVMRDVSARFAAPFVMPSGRRERVLLTLEHLLGADDYLKLRGLGVRLDTFTRAEVAERICDALAFLHRHAVVASDIAPNNLLVAFGDADEPAVCFIDCDSMVFHGRQALPSVQTGDWDIPPDFGESPSTRAADAYKLGLVVLRLFARSHDARSPAAHERFVPVELRGLVARALAPDAINRPPAGEWQRALRALMSDGRLSERYPGPTPALRRPAAARVPEAVVQRAAPGRVSAPGAPVLSAAFSPAVSWSQMAGAVWLRRAVVVAWIVAGSLVLLVVLSRLFAAAVPVPGDGVTGVTGAGGGLSPYYYQYYVPRPRAEFALPPGGSQVP